jgi:hypothetical protein
MYDKLLYQKISDVPISIIQKCVADAANVRLEDMLMNNKTKDARKREYVNARQISMFLSLEYTKHSLAVIGRHHGGRDHATVLHAKTTINNQIDTKDQLTLSVLKKARECIKEWHGRQPVRLKMDQKVKNKLIKKWIRCHVPLFIREKILLSYGKVCSECGQIRPIR